MRSLIRCLLLAACVIVGQGVARADPQEWTSEGWKTDFSRTSVPFEDILSGGPP